MLLYNDPHQKLEKQVLTLQEEWEEFKSCILRFFLLKLTLKPLIDQRNMQIFEV